MLSSIYHKDFANIFSSLNLKHKRIMLVRLKNQSPDKVARVLLNVIKSDVKGKLENNLTIISEEKVIIHKKLNLL